MSGPSAYELGNCGRGPWRPARIDAAKSEAHREAKQGFFIWPSLSTSMLRGQFSQRRPPRLSSHPRLMINVQGSVNGFPHSRNSTARTPRNLYRICS